MRQRLAGILIAGVMLLAAGALAIECEAQTKKTPCIGVLAPALDQPWHPPFMRQLATLGWVPGKNVIVEYRLAQGGYREAAEQLVQLNVDVILAISAPATHAAYEATATIPIVGQDYTNDPVAAGYAESYARPGRNVTGVFLDAPDFAGKRIELLRAIVPGLKQVAVLWDPAPGETHLRALQGAAKPFRLDLQVHEVRSASDLDKAFAAFRGRPEALIILPSPMTWTESRRLAALALKHRLPATSMAKAFVEAGGAISYGPDLDETVERDTIMVSKILKGAKPGDLPIERPNKFDFVFNMRTVKALALKIPASILPGAEQIGR